MSYNFQNLALRGAGVKGIAYAGALRVLHENNILDGIKRIAGTSAGAITALLLGLNYGIEDIEKVSSDTNFEDFMDGPSGILKPIKDFNNITKRYGIYKGDFALNWLHGLVAGEIRNTDGSTTPLNHPLSLHENATFQDLKNAGGRDLHIFSTDINTHSVVEFSADMTPNVMLAEAARASMSIPLFFEAFQFTASNAPAGKEDHIFVDGGLVYNYPISTFSDDDGPGDNTLGMVILPKASKLHQDHEFEYGHVFKYITNTFETLLNGQVIELENNNAEKERTVRIDDCGVKATDFDLPDKDKEALKASGRTAMQDYLNSHSA